MAGGSHSESEGQGGSWLAPAAPSWARQGGGSMNSRSPGASVIISTSDRLILIDGVFQTYYFIRRADHIGWKARPSCLDERYGE